MGASARLGELACLGGVTQNGAAACTTGAVAGGVRGVPGCLEGLGLQLASSWDWRGDGGARTRTGDRAARGVEPGVSKHDERGVLQLTTAIATPEAELACGCWSAVLVRASVPRAWTAAGATWPAPPLLLLAAAGASCATTVRVGKTAIGSDVRGLCLVGEAASRLPKENRPEGVAVSTRWEDCVWRLGCNECTSAQHCVVEVGMVPTLIAVATGSAGTDVAGSASDGTATATGKVQPTGDGNAEDGARLYSGTESTPQTPRGDKLLGSSESSVVTLLDSTFPLMFWPPELPRGALPGEAVTMERALPSMVSPGTAATGVARCSATGIASGAAGRGRDKLGNGKPRLTPPLDAPAPRLQTPTPGVLLATLLPQWPKPAAWLVSTVAVESLGTGELLLAGSVIELREGTSLRVEGTKQLLNKETEHDHLRKMSNFKRRRATCARSSARAWSRKDSTVEKCHAARVALAPILAREATRRPQAETAAAVEVAEAALQLRQHFQAISASRCRPRAWLCEATEAPKEAATSPLERKVLFCMRSFDATAADRQPVTDALNLQR